MSDRKLKILNFNSGFLPDKGGVATYSWELTRHLSQNNEVEKVQVIAFNVSSGDDEENDPRYKIKRIKRGTYNLMTLGFKILGYLIKYHNYQIIYATNLFPIGLWVMIWAKLLGKKYFITIYGTDTLSRLGTRKTHWFKKMIMKNAAAVFSISHSTTDKTLVEYNLDGKNFITIHPGVTQKFTSFLNPNLKKELGYQDDDFIILTICHLVARKGVGCLMRALNQIENKKIKLLIVGHGPEREKFEKLAQDLGLSERVKFVGKVEEVDSYYNLADIFALTSYYDKTGDIEGFGLVLGEAQWRKIPVIGTESGAIPETMKNNETGFIVPEKDSHALKEKILLLYNNPELRQKMGEQGHQFVAENFDWSEVAKKYITVYKKYL